MTEQDKTLKPTEEEIINVQNSQQTEQKPKKKTVNSFLEKKKFQRILQKYLKINHPLLEIQGSNCQCQQSQNQNQNPSDDQSREQQNLHDNGCLTQIFDMSVRGFGLGYAVKTALNLLLTLIKKPKTLVNPINLVLLLVNRESFGFAMFPCIYNFVLQSFTCGLREIRARMEGKNKGKYQQFEKIIEPFISGFAAGFLALLVKSKKDRAIWGLFLMTRALECFYNSMINKGYIPYTKYNWIIFFALLWICQGYNIAMEPDNCPKPFQKFIGTQMCQDAGDHSLNIAWIKKKNMELKKQFGDSVPEQDPFKLLKKPTKQVQLFGFKDYETPYLKKLNKNK